MENQYGLYVARVTENAPPQAKKLIKVGAQITKVNDRDLTHVTFDDGVNIIGNLKLPVNITFNNSPKNRDAFIINMSNNSSNNHHKLHGNYDKVNIIYTITINNICSQISIYYMIIFT